jgi:hypothetical protein
MQNGHSAQNVYAHPFEGGAITAYGHLELMVCTFKNNTADNVSGAGSGSVLRVAVHLLRCGWSV